MDQTYILGIILLFLIIYFFYSSKENFDNKFQTKDRYRGELNEGVYKYTTNDINRGLRPV